YPFLYEIELVVITINIAKETI
ncbi:hypothetical protein A2U01_0089465, partial [Trifolium medium]|nr:hypothetical protein [Trifolium medium]